MGAQHPSLKLGSDPMFAKLGVFFSVKATPLVMLLDARTMEICYSDLGAIETKEGYDALIQPIIDQNKAY